MRVALAAHGFAASLRLLLMDSTEAGVHDFCSLGPARMMGESRGMQTRASNLSWSAVVDGAMTEDAPSVEAVGAATGDHDSGDGAAPTHGLANSNSMISQIIALASWMIGARLVRTIPKS